jgi:hypothetical protein
MARSPSKPFHCSVISENVSIALRRRSSFRGDGKLYVQCSEVDCQWIDANEPPVRVDLYVRVRNRDLITEVHRDGLRIEGRRGTACIRVQPHEPSHLVAAPQEVGIKALVKLSPEAIDEDLADRPVGLKSAIGPAARGGDGSLNRALLISLHYDGIRVVVDNDVGGPGEGPVISSGRRRQEHEAQDEGKY